MRIVFNKNKNEKLKKERGISFETVIEKIVNGEIVGDYEHPNKDKYPNQRMLIVLIDGYPCCVPYVKEKDKIILKTAYKSRKIKKLIDRGEL